MPSGRVSGRNVLDVDVKDPTAYGFDTLEDLGWAILPVTATVHTGSGSLQLHFDDAREIGCTTGARGRGIGPGLDWRGTGGYVILPSPGSGYWWDPHYGPDTPLAAVPDGLLFREPKPAPISSRPIKPTSGLSLYAEAELDSACRAILAAPSGEQEATANAQSFWIGTLAGARGYPGSFRP